MTRWSCVLRHAALPAAVTVLVLARGAGALTLDRFTLPLPDSRIEIGGPALPGDRGTRSAAVIAGGMVVSPPEEWQALAVGGEEFLVLHRDWRGARLDIDCGSGAVYRVSGDGMTAPDPSTRIALKDAVCKTGADGATRVVSFPSVELTYHPADNLVRIEAAGFGRPLALAAAEGWEVENTGISLYRLRRREWQKGEFWDVDAARRTAQSAAGKRLDLVVVEENPGISRLKVEFVPKGIGLGVLARKDHTLRKKAPKNDPTLDPLLLRVYESGVPVLRSATDVPQGKSLAPASRWREQQEEAYTRALAGEPCDVLVVPFQVQGNALDRIERALATRYLSAALARRSGLRLPNPTLIARALGEGARLIPDEKIYGLANLLGARTLITGFIGHDREERMQVTILVRERRDDAPLGPDLEPVRHVWNDILFSDERLPSEAFLGILGDVLARIVPSQATPPAPASAAATQEPAVPATFGEAARGGAGDPARDAFQLQLLGLLSRGGGMVAESFFERSLVALQGLAADAPDYRLLKAGAYAALGRRPAALAALGSPRTAEEQALGASLNGDLPSLEAQVTRITRPVPRLMARIRLNDLRWAYGGDREVLAREAGRLAEENQGFGGLLADRLEETSSWAHPSALPVKQEFDVLFPVEGQGLAELVGRGRATGEGTSEEDLDLSIYNQSHRVLQRGLFAAAGDAAPVPGDALDLLVDAAERATAQRVRGLVLTQGLPEEGLALLARYERISPDHPELTSIKLAALGGMMQKLTGEARSQVEKEAYELAEKVFVWGEGQTPAVATAKKHCGLGRYALPSYDADYPRRPYWVYDTVGDRRSFAAVPATGAFMSLPATTRHELKNAWISLAYTTDDLRILKDLHRKLLELDLAEEAAALLQANRQRFQGHVLWPDLLAQAAAKDPQAASARRVYTQAIAADPRNWDSYFELGRILIGEGDYGGASRVFLSYPLFREPERADRVGLSHAAYGAAVELLFRGATEEAIPVLETAAGLETGSGSEIGALAYLAQVRDDFAGAARQFRDRGNRYRSRGSYGIYIGFLHLAGAHQEAEALFDSLNAGPEENGLWNAAVGGLRSMGKTDEEVFAWFQARALGKFMLPVTDGEPLVLAFLVDRGPNDLLPRFLSGRKDAAGVLTAWFAEGYRLLRLGRHEDAYRTLLTRFNDPGEETLVKFRYALPALAWTGVRSGNGNEVESLLQRYRVILGEDFHYRLALALLRGGQGNAEEATAELEKARASIDVSYPPIDYSFPWYQLLEAVEWLHEQSGWQAYLDLLVPWAQTCQKLYPTEAWSYAMEARHAASAERRTRALGIALFMDRNGQRISGCSAAETEAARAWLRVNNPFVRMDGNQRSLTTF